MQKTELFRLLMLFRNTCNKLTKFTAHRSVKPDLTINLGSVFVSDNPRTILSVVQFCHFFLQLLSPRTGKKKITFLGNIPNTCKSINIQSAKFLLNTRRKKTIKVPINTLTKTIEQQINKNLEQNRKYHWQTVPFSKNCPPINTQFGNNQSNHFYCANFKNIKGIFTV